METSWVGGVVGSERLERLQDQSYGGDLSPILETHGKDFGEEHRPGEISRCCWDCCIGIGRDCAIWRGNESCTLGKQITRKALASCIHSVVMLYQPGSMGPINL